MRPAVAHGHPEALRTADHDVRVELAGRLEQTEGQEVGGDDREPLAPLDPGDDLARVPNLPARTGVLQQSPEHHPILQVLEGISHHDLPAHRSGAGAHDRDRLRVTVAIDEKGVGLALRHPSCHRHRLRRCGGLVEERGVGELHAGEVHHHLLEVEQRLEAPLTDLGLVGGVSGVPAWVLQHVALDDARQHRAVVPHAHHADEHPVALAHPARGGHELPFAHRRRKVEGLVGADLRGHRLFDQRLEGIESEEGKHLLDLPLSGADVATHEVAAHLQFLEASPASIAHVHSSFRRDPRPCVTGIRLVDSDWMELPRPTSARVDSRTPRE